MSLSKMLGTVIGALVGITIVSMFLSACMVHTESASRLGFPSTNATSSRS